MQDFKFNVSMVNNYTSTTKKKKKLPSSRQSFTLTKRKGHASPTTQLPICKLKDTKITWGPASNLQMKWQSSFVMKKAHNQPKRNYKKPRKWLITYKVIHCNNFYCNCNSQRQTLFLAIQILCETIHFISIIFLMLLPVKNTHWTEKKKKKKIKTSQINIHV